MKITRKQLRRIIERIGGGRRYSEIPAHPRGDLGKNIADVDFPIVVKYEGQSEIVYNQDELDDILDMITPSPGGKADIPYSLESLSDMEPESEPAGRRIERYAEGTVKITRRNLRRIVKEYYEEYLHPDHIDGMPWTGTMEDFATVQAKTFGHGKLANPEVHQQDIDIAREFAKSSQKIREILGENDSMGVYNATASVVGPMSKVVTSAFGEADEVIEAEPDADSAAGKKLDKALDSSAMNAFKTALDQAKNKNQVKEVLSQIFNELGDDGKKYLKQALKELANEM